MWNRRELKARAKMAFKSNYWKCVLVAIIIALLVGATGAATARFSGSADVTINGENVTTEELAATVQQAIAQVAAERNISTEEVMEALVVAGTALAAVGTLFVMTSSLLRIFVWNLFEIGGDYFFTLNTESNAQLREIFRGFSDRYGRNVLALFLRSLYIALWSLLFVLPGIIKTYSYRLMPYLLAEHPEMSRKEAFRMSRKLMKGNKWRAFVLDLSFLGWDILSIFTFGLLQIFYVRPYKAAANAELYKTLADKDNF